MIKRDVFFTVWARLCRRFGQTNDPEMAREFYDYLSQRLDDDAFVAAAQAVWATNRFFPRPADFLAVQSGADWALVLDAIDGHSPPAWTWTEPWGRISAMGQDATRAVGGIAGLAALDSAELLHAKREWDRAYERALTAGATQVLALPAAREVA